MQKLLALTSLLLLISCSPSSKGGRKPASALIDGVEDGELRIFISSSTHDGNLGGLSGANTICKELAKAAGLERTYKALISTSTSSISGRLKEDGKIYIFESDESKILVANSLDELWDSETTNLNHAVNLDESFNSIPSVHVWTGSNSNGSADADNTCTNWTDNTIDVDGIYGNSDAVDSVFLEDAFETCDQLNHIICISQ